MPKSKKKEPEAAEAMNTHQTFPTVEEFKRGQKNPALASAEHTQVFTTSSAPQPPKVTGVPMSKSAPGKEKLPENACAPSSDALSHLKAKREEENKRAAAIIPMKNTGEIIEPSRMTAIEARMAAVEHTLYSPTAKAS